MHKRICLCMSIRAMLSPCPNSFRLVKTIEKGLSTHIHTYTFLDHKYSFRKIVMLKIISNPNSLLLLNLSSSNSVINIFWGTYRSVHSVTTAYIIIIHLRLQMTYLTWKIIIMIIHLRRFDMRECKLWHLFLLAYLRYLIAMFIIIISSSVVLNTILIVITKEISFSFLLLLITPNHFMLFFLFIIILSNLIPIHVIIKDIAIILDLIIHGLLALQSLPNRYIRTFLIEHTNWWMQLLFRLGIIIRIIFY